MIKLFLIKLGKKIGITTMRITLISFVMAAWFALILITFELVDWSPLQAAQYTVKAQLSSLFILLVVGFVYSYIDFKGYIK